MKKKFKKLIYTILIQLLIAVITGIIIKILNEFNMKTFIIITIVLITVGAITCFYFLIKWYIQEQKEKLNQKFKDVNNELEIMRINQKLKDIYFSQSITSLFKICKNLSENTDSFYKDVFRKEDKHIYKFLFQANDDNENYYPTKLMQIDFYNKFNQFPNVDFLFEYISQNELNNLGLTNQEIEIIKQNKNRFKNGYSNN